MYADLKQYIALAMCYFVKYYQNMLSHLVTVIAACEFKCVAEDKCIKQENVCDGWKDCFSSGQDEQNCGKSHINLQYQYTIN